MKKILSLVIIASVSSGLYADAADVITNIASLAKGIPISKEQQGKKDKLVNVLNSAAKISISVQQFMDTLDDVQKAANLTYKRATCIGKSSQACVDVGCTSEQACIQKLLIAINQFLKPTINSLLGEKLSADQVKPGALLALLSILPPESEKRKIYEPKLISYVQQLNDIFDFLSSLGFIINPAALSEKNEDTAKMSEALKKSLAEEVVKVELPKQELQVPADIDLSEFM